MSTGFQRWYDEGRRTLDALRGADRPSEVKSDLERALAAFEQAYALEPRRPGLQRERALILARLGDHATALDAFVAAIDETPSDVDLRLAAARSFVALGQHDTALTAFEEVLQRRPGDPGALFGRASSLFALGRDELAVAAWDQWLLTRAPDRLWLHGEDFRETPHAMLRPTALVSRACALARLKRREAFQAFTELFSGVPGMTREHYLEALRTHPIAREAYQAHVDAHADDPRVHEEAAHAWRAAGDPHAALAAWDLVVQRAPTAEAWAGKAACHELLGQLDAAVEAFQASLSLWAEFRPALLGVRRVREARAEQHTGPWTVMGRDTFAREDFVVGTFATKAEAERCLARKEASAGSQDAALRDAYWLAPPGA